MTSQAVLDLGKKLQELEAQAKMLRNDVSNLEATHHNLTISESTQVRAMEINRTAAEEEEAESQAGSSKRRARASRPRQLPLCQDFIDDLARKAGDVQSTIERHRALTREKEDLLAILERVQGEGDAAEQAYYDLAELAGADDDGNSAVGIGLRKKNDYSAARNELLGLYRQREVLRKAMQVQTDELARIAAMIEDTANAEEQKSEAVAVLAEKRAKLTETRKERQQLERSLRTQENVLEKKPTGPTPEDVVRSANYDRRVAMHELEKENTQLMQNDAAVRNRAMQIAKAEKRVEMIGDAVAGEGLSEEDRVDVELMDELIKETNALHNLHQEASIRMEMLDAKIEKIDYKIAAIGSAIKGTDRERERIARQHTRYLTTLQKDYNHEQTINAQEINRAEMEVDKVRRSTANSTSRSRPSACSAKA